jgi:phosphoribosylformylglycinamidine synthase
VDLANVDQLRTLATQYEIALHDLGITGGDSLIINEARIPLTELRRAHTETLPKLFG